MDPKAKETQSQPTSPTTGQTSQPPTGQATAKVGVLKKFPKKISKKTVFYALSSLLVILLGVGTGWALSGTRGAGSDTPTSAGAPGAETGAKEAGIADEATFRDTAEGVLEDGGIDGEGTHHLVREGGPSKYVYLTSTVIDLEAFVGKTVSVWGETISAQTAGWLMDVGKIKVSE
ncbi:hypothetical protein DRH13_04710 [Candidatus Woesebacteria bacterium]|nr:MAG: hypothetical protein DRH13_04710 [Candidatus Woesebacteria bacterium]